YPVGERDRVGQDRPRFYSVGFDIDGHCVWSRARVADFETRFERNTQRRWKRYDRRASSLALGDCGVRNRACAGAVDRSRVDAENVCAIAANRRGIRWQEPADNDVLVVSGEVLR